MPSGRAHSTIGLTVIGIGAPLIALSDMVPPEAKIPMIGGLCFGWAFTPDLDLGQVHTHDEKRLLKIPVFGKLIVMHFAGYGELFNHRGISHWPIIGTLTRFFWLLRPVFTQILVLSCLVWFGMAEITWLIDPEPIATDWILPFFMGWTIQDLAHELADVLVSEHKRKLRERKL